MLRCLELPPRVEIPYIGDGRANFTLGASKRCNPSYISIYHIYVKPCIPYGSCTNFRTGSSCIVIQTAVEARERPRLDHERFRPSQLSGGLATASSKVLRTSLSHMANLDRIDPRQITNKLSTKLGHYSHCSLLGFKNGWRLNSTAEHGYGISKLTRTLGWRIPRTPSSRSPVALHVAVE